VARDPVPGHVDLVSQTYQRLRDLIVAGRLAPGSRIIESDLAARLEVSRTPVRSALHRLEQEGWVTGSGTGKQHRLAVSPLTEKDARELFALLGTLEGMAARLAAALPTRERTALVRALRALNQELRREAMSARPDPWRVFELHSAFHLRLVEAIEAPRLRALHQAIKPQVDRYRQAYSAALVPVALEAAAEHDAVLRGIRAGDPEHAEQATRTHWSNAAERMCRIVVSWGEKGHW
jgi:DNA-binding GntR family transcriptional regulator